MTNHNTSTEQQTNALQALAECEERYRNLVEASPDAIFVHQEERIAFANASTLILLLAREPEDLLGKSITKIIHPDFLPAFRQQNQLCLRTGIAAYPMEQLLTRLDGSLVEIEAVAIPCMWNGAPAVEVVARDITERKRAELERLSNGRNASNWRRRLPSGSGYGNGTSAKTSSSAHMKRVANSATRATILRGLGTIFARGFILKTDLESKPPSRQCWMEA